jgi:hypothetical protein
MRGVERKVKHPKWGEGKVRLDGMGRYAGRFLVQFAGFYRWAEIEDLEFLD